MRPDRSRRGSTMLSRPAPPPPPAAVTRYRAVFISDLHLGSRACKADHLFDFIRHVEADYLYLIGDIIDGWSLRKRWHWPKSHDDILKRLISLRHRCKVFYLPGNHDDCMRG